MMNISKGSQSLAGIETRSSIKYVRCITTTLLASLSGKSEDNFDEKNLLI
jgi:hypothetical protein